jgi:DNA-binding NarL/FixJ family response regulator
MLAREEVSPGTAIHWEAAANLRARETEKPSGHAEDRRLRIILAEDDGAMRERLCRLLSSEYNVVATFSDGGTILEKANTLNPDLVILDISLPVMNGFSVARGLRYRMPAVPIVFVTQHADPPYIEEAFRSGAAAYIAKRSVVTDLPSALEQVHRGTSYLSPSLCRV